MLEQYRDVQGGLALDFGVPPFSILDARQGYWEDRKRRWIDLGLRSEIGRGVDSRAIQHVGHLVDENKGSGVVSIFDPVLAELLYSWFTPVRGKILDPFSGGSVRGIVAAHMDREYVGIDIRTEQIEANAMQLDALSDYSGSCRWIHGDSSEVIPNLEREYDFVFSCPPYGNLEVYSEVDGDVSNMSPLEFERVYREIIASACSKLKSGRFAAWVVGDYRNSKTGYLRNFVSNSIQAFLDAGLQLWNECVLITSLGTLPMRARSSFETSRKIGKTHQNVLVFVKGDPVAAVENLGECQMVQLPEAGHKDQFELW